MEDMDRYLSTLISVIADPETQEERDSAEDTLRGFVEGLADANDRLARIASSVAVQLEEGKRDLMAHGWDRGYRDAALERENVFPAKNPWRGEAAL